jgi:hypothetical protein
MGLEVYVAKSYERGKLTLREAAHLLRLNLIETTDLLSEMGVKGNIKAKDVMQGLKELPRPPSFLTGFVKSTTCALPTFLVLWPRGRPRSTVMWISRLSSVALPDLKNPSSTASS